MKKDIKKNLTLHLVSDSTGETLKAVSAAAAAQFSEVEYQQKTYPMVRTITQLERVFKNIKDEKGNLIGDLRSACYSPHFKKSIGIAMINEPYCKASASGLLEIDGNLIAVKVCDLPFI